MALQCVSGYSGAIGRSAFGMKFSDFLQERLFGPLDMRDTAFSVDADQMPRLAQLYKPEGMTANNFMAPSTGSGLEVADARISVPVLSSRQNLKAVVPAWFPLLVTICDFPK